ncbi:hypothetical protein V8C42DRAFT_255980 [Trichoderma barbatum]
MDLETIAITERSARGLPRDISPSSSSPSSCRTYSIDSRSSISTKPSSRDTSPATEKEKGSGTRGRSRLNPKQAASPWNLMFHPRSCEEIYAERAYLTASLHVYSVQVIELIHRYSLIEEDLQSNDHAGKERRKLRKQMNFIKVKLSEASRQEKAVMLRMGELHMEQLGRDAWDQIQQRRMSYSAFQFEAVIPLSASSETPLSADSKEFVPSAAHSDSSEARAQSSASEVGKPRTLDTVVEAREGEENDGESLKEDGCRIDDEDDEDDTTTGAEYAAKSEDLCNHGLEYTYQACSSIENSQLRPSHLSERLSACPEDRRKSLPNLYSLWPGATNSE